MILQSKKLSDNEIDNLSKIVALINKNKNNKSIKQSKNSKSTIKKTELKNKKIKSKENQKKQLLKTSKQNLSQSDDLEDEKLFDNVQLQIEDDNVKIQQEGDKGQKTKQKQNSKQRKKVTFNDVVDVRFDQDKKWDAKIQDEKQGKFSPEQRQTLQKSIIKYCRLKNFSEKEFEDIILNTTSEVRHMKMWTTICSVLPNRSINSCFKFIKRKFNPQNYQGKWTKQQQQLLVSLVQEYGRKWVRISRQIGRTAENVRDKYVSLGEQNLENREIQFWKIQQLITLLKGVQNQFKKRFLDKSILHINLYIDNQLADSKKHNQKQMEQRNQRKKMSANFIFHNLSVLKKYIFIKKFNKLNIQNIQWSTIAQQIKSRSKQDCRNKWKQIVNIIHQENQNFSYHEDKQLIMMIQKQNPDNQYQIDFAIANKKTALQNKIRWNTLKKFVSGRIQKPIKQIIQQIKKKIEYKQEQKQYNKKKETNELLEMYKEAIKLQNLEI